MVTFNFGPTVADGVPEHLSTEADKVRQALSCKEGWQRFANETVSRPKVLTLEQLEQLEQRQRAKYDAAREQAHRSLVITQHTQLARLWAQMRDIVMGQAFDDGPGMGIALTGGPGFGKTATTVGFCREYERQLRQQHPAAFHQENEFVPVCYSSLVRGAGLKAQMEHILRFFGQPLARRITGAALVDVLVDVLNACRTQILVLDQAQNLHAGDRKDDQVAACLKEIMDASHATVILTGIDIDITGPLAAIPGGRLQASNDRLQLARRFSLLRLERVAKESDEWRNLLATIESQFSLVNAKPGDIALGLVDEVWEMSQGAIGVAFNMLRVAANHAISDGSERITHRTLKAVARSVETAQSGKAA